MTPNEMKLTLAQDAFMPSSQETDWAYSITTVPGTHTGHTVCKVQQQFSQFTNRTDS